MQRASAGGRGVGGGAWGGGSVGQPINAKPRRRGSAAVQFREITFLINVIEGVEVGLLSEVVLSVPLCILGSLASSQKSSIHNEPAQRMDKSPRNIR